MYRKALLSFIFILISTFAIGSFVVAKYSQAQTSDVEDLKNKIDTHGDLIKRLEAEIAQYNQELDKTSAQALSLQRSIRELDLNSKKLATDIELTQTKIGTTNNQIQVLTSDISKQESSILRSREVLAQSLKRMSENDSVSLIESLFKYRNLSDFSNEIETQGQFRVKIQEHLLELQKLKVGLETNKQLTEAQKKELLTLQSDLSSQKTSVTLTKNEKDKVLAQTKNQESNYKTIIANKKAARAAFEKELLNFESQLKIAIDPASIPGAKPGVLAWPTAKRTVTQTFGDTAFSRTTNAYSGKGHNGIDIGIPVGTKIMSAGVGTVAGSGDTDTVCPGASFGKWIMVTHTNGLSTLYAHLSSIQVSKGDNVNPGDVIGYSGNTGYSTGPHLHFTVYASQGVQIVSRKSAACGGTYVMPIADLKAYLNPLSYL
ncbi:MAG: peptidoglycan DD-metalloendopeptidase family protein [Patescibacteria group bacterium]